MWKVAVSMPCRDRPGDGALEDGGVVLIHAEDEAGVDHHAQGVQAADGLFVRVALPQVMRFALLAQVLGVEALEADEERAQPASGGFFQQAGLQNGAHGGGGLPDASHAAHAFEQRRGEARVAEQVIVQEVEVAPGQALDLPQGGVDGLRVKRSAALEEGVFVAEIAVVRAAARDDQRVGHQVEVTLDQVAAHGGSFSSVRRRET